MRPALLVALLLVTSTHAEEPVRKDHATHFIVGLGIGAIGHAATPMALPDAPQWAPLAVGVAGSMVAGAVKEIADAAGLGVPEWEDWAATVAGGLAGSILSSLLMWAMAGVVP